MRFVIGFLSILIALALSPPSLADGFLLAQATGTVGPPMFQKPKSCSSTTSSNCSLPVSDSGSYVGSCASGYTGACQFQCFRGSWNQVSNTCAMACAGASVGGYCWYLGSAGQTCDQVCVSHGGCNLNGIQNYAGHGGSLANCVAVMAALGKTGTSGENSAAGAIGCYFTSLGGTQIQRAIKSATTCGYFNVYANRACSCAN